MYRINWFETQKQCKKCEERNTFARQENVYWVPATSFLCLSARLTVRGGTREENTVRDTGEENTVRVSLGGKNCQGHLVGK